MQRSERRLCSGVTRVSSGHSTGEISVNSVVSSAKKLCGWLSYHTCNKVQDQRFPAYPGPTRTHQAQGDHAMQCITERLHRDRHNQPWGDTNRLMQDTREQVV